MRQDFQYNTRRIKDVVCYYFLTGERIGIKEELVHFWKRSLSDAGSNITVVLLFVSSVIWAVREQVSIESIQLDYETFREMKPSHARICGDISTDSVYLYDLLELDLHFAPAEN